MSTLTIRLPNSKRERQKPLVCANSISLLKLTNGLATVALASFGGRVRFEALVAPGDFLRSSALFENVELAVTCCFPRARCIQVGTPGCPGAAPESTLRVRHCRRRRVDRVWAAPSGTPWIVVAQSAWRWVDPAIQAASFHSCSIAWTSGLSTLVDLNSTPMNWGRLSEE